MNIFVIDPDPWACAVALDDLRLNKMILETAQLLSTAMRMQGYSSDTIYKSTHVNHPCAVWARTNASNYMWLLVYLSHLLYEKNYRTGKTHKTNSIYSELCNGTQLMPPGNLTPWPNCTPNKHISDIHEAYCVTLTDKWANDKRPPKWTNRARPTW